MGYVKDAQRAVRDRRLVGGAVASIKRQVECRKRRRKRLCGQLSVVKDHARHVHFLKAVIRNGWVVLSRNAKCKEKGLN